MFSQSNVYAAALLLEAANDPSQLVYYHSGPGTSASESIQNVKDSILEDLFGNIDDYMFDAYAWLARNYRAGDSVYAFGHSRGAGIVRSLFNFIRTSGLLDTGSHDFTDQNTFLRHIKQAYDHYKTKGDASDFKAKYCFPSVNLEFLGVWDTVPSLDIPNGIFSKSAAAVMSDIGHTLGLIEENRFHDFSITDSLPYAYHALSIDEISTILLPILFENAKECGWKDRHQNWFRGHHGDVGGHEIERGLGDISLEWMLANARRAGLSFVDSNKFHDTIESLCRVGTEKAMLQRRHAYVLHPTMSLHLPGEDAPRDVVGYIQRGLKGDGVFPSVVDASVSEIVVENAADAETHAQGGSIKSVAI
ncbi:hypothetical protein HDU82_003870 [Entophlyctis luteolus]|nr:hypothetical protein HDU82_003870 [Entophlyctis luteolus]